MGAQPPSAAVMPQTHGTRSGRSLYKSRQRQGKRIPMQEWQRRDQDQREMIFRRIAARSASGRRRQENKVEERRRCDASDCKGNPRMSAIEGGRASSRPFRREVSGTAR